MRRIDWFKPGTKVKLWIVLGIAGILMTSLGIAGMIYSGFLFSWSLVICLVLAGAGIVTIYFAYRMSIKSLTVLMGEAGYNNFVSFKNLGRIVYDKQHLVRGPKIVVVGGGTGLSTMLRGLKHYTSNITAIVTVADDGGGSGVLREELGILPPGDIRNCILALADTEPVMEELLQYRFKDGMLKGQSFGNLFLAAMDGISDNFEDAIKKMSDVLAVTGRVLPVTLSNIKLYGELENGVIIEGESKISKREQHRGIPIKRVFIEPPGVLPLKEAISAIDEADAVILGPGSLYTSIIPNLLVEEMAFHIENCNALRIYVSNIMTQPGETTGYSVCDHIDSIHKYAKGRIIDCVIANTGHIPEWLCAKYEDDGASEVKMDRDRIKDRGIKVLEDDFVLIYKNLVRHNSKKLAHVIMDLILDRKLSQSKGRNIGVYYPGEGIKEAGGQGG